MKYKIISSNIQGQWHLERLTQEWVDAGWKTNGPPFNDGKLLCREMMKEDDK